MYEYVTRTLSEVRGLVQGSADIIIIAAQVHVHLSYQPTYIRNVVFMFCNNVIYVLCLYSLLVIVLVANKNYNTIRS